MKLGYFTMPLHPVGKDWQRTLAEDREAILLAEELGFEEAFIGEHITDLAETITSCLIFIATLAAARSISPTATRRRPRPRSRWSTRCSRAASSSASVRAACPPMRR